MRCVSGVVTAVLAVGYLFGGGCATADAADKEHFDQWLMSAGFDLWRDGGSAYGALQWSPDGLARDGLTFKILVAGGPYAYNSGGTPFAGRYALTSAMAGWRLKTGHGEVTFFVGPDFQSHRVIPDDPDNRMRGARGGIRFGGDLWYQSTEAFMATGSVSISTIGPTYWSRAAIGWHLFGSAWIGPEVMALGGDRYQQLRAGVHATAFRTEAFEWSAGFGYARDSNQRDGAYVRFGVLTRR